MTCSVSYLFNIPFRKCHILVVVSVSKLPFFCWHISPWWISNIPFQYVNNVVIQHPVIKTIIPTEGKSSMEMLVNIIREIFSNQLLIWFLFWEILLEGRSMVFEVFKDKRPNFMFLHWHKQELNCLDNTLFAISFVICVTCIHKGQPLGGFTLFFMPPYTLCTKFIFADVDVIKELENSLLMAGFLIFNSIFPIYPLINCNLSVHADP